MRKCVALGFESRRKKKLYIYIYMYINVYIYTYICIYIYCEFRNISVELLLATLTSGPDSLILRSAHICSIFKDFLSIYGATCVTILTHSTSFFLSK